VEEINVAAGQFLGLEDFQLSRAPHISFSAQLRTIPKPFVLVIGN
jgi:hypothetical protein